MFEKFRQRSRELERLDTGDYTDAEYARWQNEMWYIHRFFGELRALRNSLYRDLSSTDGVSILDVGAGSGGLLDEVRKWFAGRASVTGIELNEAAAKQIKNRSIDVVRADGLKLPFADDAFTTTFCTLTLHHLNAADAAKLIAEMARVSSERIYVIDLTRDAKAYYLYKVFGGVLLQRFSLEDGALSILRSYTPDELYEIAKLAGLQQVKIERSFINRIVLSGKKW